MQPLNPRFPALRKRRNRLALGLLFFLFSSTPLLFLGCAGTNSSAEQSSAPGENPAAAPVEAAASAPSPSATAKQSHINKKSASQVHIAVEKASQASETAAEASQKALQASKQARQAANAASQAEGSAGSSKNVVTLETPGLSSRSTPGASLEANGGPAPTPAARPQRTADLEGAGRATASLPAVASSDDPKPPNAAKLIDDVDKTEKRIDRSNLSADESQRDILAQRLLQDAKRALADRDNVAATSLATKASILLAPLPEIPAPASSSMR